MTHDAAQLALDWSPPSVVKVVAEKIEKVRPPHARRDPKTTPAKPTLKLVPASVIVDEPLVDRRGLPRTRATMPGAGTGRIPVTKGRRYPPDPVTASEVNAMLQYLSKPRNKYETRHGKISRIRLRALVAVLWRSGLRISEALDLEPRDLNRSDYCITVRHGKGDKRRISAMDEWGWKMLDQWFEVRGTLPHGPVFCVVSGTSAGMRWSSADVRRQMKATAKSAGVARRVAPHQFRHAHAADLWREGVDVFVVQKQLGHARLDVTAHYLSSVAPVELLEPIGRRKAPHMPVTAD
jgi:site-specific recombinase XerD